MAVEVLYTAHAVAEGGRNGHTRSGDGMVSVDLSVPQVMGGPGRAGTTTPEDLFAAGYAACFGSAVDYQAKLMKLVPESLEINCAVGIGKSGDGFGLQVDIEAKVAGLSQEDAEKIVNAGHEFCPYSRAVKGNVDVTVKTTVV